MILRTFRGRTLAVAAVGALTLTGTALAAHPNASKKYGGPTSAKKFNGYRSQVTFKVAKDGKSLQNFTYQSVGCYGAGGNLQKGVNYLAKPWNVHKLGTISVASNGSFSRRNVLTRYTTQGYTTITKSTVAGRFTTSSKASGTISFTQSETGPKGVLVPRPCGPVKITFTATQAAPSGGGITGGY